MLGHVLQPVVCRILRTGCPVDIELVILHLVSAIHNIPGMEFPVIVIESSVEECCINYSVINLINSSNGGEVSGNPCSTSRC